MAYQLKVIHNLEEMEGQIESLLGQRPSEEREAWHAALEHRSQRFASSGMAYGLAAFGDEDDARMIGFLGLQPSCYVSQWGTEFPVCLGMPLAFVEGVDEERLARFLLKLGVEYLESLKQEERPLALVSFARKSQELLRELGFCHAWEYTLSCSLPLEEEHCWLKAIDRATLQRHGGEIELPSKLSFYG